MNSSSLRHCLIHQLPESSTSPVGNVCPQCKRMLYLTASPNPPFPENRQAFWLSQPGAYTLDRQPLFVYIRQGPGYQIRSLIEEAAPVW